MKGLEPGNLLRSLLSRLLSRPPPAAPREGPSAATHTPDEWQQIQDVLNAALEIATPDRAAFVDNAFVGRPTLSGEVHSLLTAHSRAGMLDRPPPDLAPSPGSAGDDARGPNGIVDRYEMLGRVGGGGMGVVYRARDRRLERIVALKFLPPHLSADHHAKGRFRVEAQAAAALDHPNVCTIHEIGETDDGQLFLAMPFYDGETLKDRLAAGPIAPEQATHIAVQIARGLASAHDRGIVHRDIKPANIAVTSDGVAKILDFGIAKLADVNLTSPGTTPGTVAYMSPEQARGDEVDARTDLWSLGVVLYEMLAGERPFRGTHDGVVLNAIRFMDPPPLAAAHPDVTALLENVVSRALARAKGNRYSDAREMAAALEAALAAESSHTASAGSTALDGSRTSSRPSAAPAAITLPEGERRNATIVASTLSGYDVMIGSLVPAEVERLVGRIRVEAATVAARHGGTLNDFAGDQMVLLFGIPATHEDDGVRAVRAALDLHARMRALSGEIEQTGGPALGLHTGIDTGRVIVHALPGQGGAPAYRVTGRAAEIATRLALAAGGDEVWTGPACHHLIMPFFATEPRDPLPIRGRTHPLIPHRVFRESGFQTRLEAAEKMGLTPFVGRAEDLAALQRHLELATRGDARFAVVTGEAGIGKSRLLHEFRSTLGDRDVSLLIGRCQSDATSVPYLPFVEILRSALRPGEPGPDVLENTVARIRAIGAELEEFIPLYLHLLSIPGEDFPVPQHLHGDTFSRAIREALAAILTLSARRRPCIVLLEDLHWADEATLAVLEQLIEVMSGYHLLVIATSRAGFGVELDNVDQRTLIPLSPLSPSHLETLLMSLLGVQSIPGELAASLHERTGGNPFFLEEICMALLEEKSIRIEGGAAHVTDRLLLLDLPDSVEAVIRARLDRLDVHARDVLRLASVVGRDFTRDVLEDTVTDRGLLPEAIETLKAAGLIQQIQVVPQASYRFKHVLTREVAYSSLLEHQRRDLHGRVGARIEQLGGDRIEDHLERLAHHFSRAEEWEKAVRYGMRSAERAGSLAQYAEALQILERTQRRLINLPRGRPREHALLEILLRQERLSETLGLRGRQQQIIDELIRLLEPDGDRTTLAEVYLRQGDVHTLLHQYGDGEKALQRSLEMRRQIGDTEGEHKALRSLGLLRWYEGRNDEALTCITEVVAMDRQRNDVVALLGDLTSLANVLKAKGEPLRARACLEEGIAIADDAIAAGSPVAGDLRVKQAYILNSLVILCREAGELDLALEHLQRAERIAEVRRLPVYLPYHHVVAAHIHLQQGRVEESLARYRTAVDLARKAGYVPGLSQTLSIQGEVLLGLKRYHDALPCLEEAAELFARLEDRRTESLMWTHLAVAREKVGDDPGAIAAWSKARSLRRQFGATAGELEALEGLGAATRRHAADPALALTHYYDALSLAHGLGDRAAEGRLRNTIGILEWSRGEFAPALDQFERALVIFSELGDAAHAGLMLNSVAVSLKELGRLEEARNRLEAAVALHRENGQRQLEGHALAALGDISMALGSAEPAVGYYEQSLEIRRRIGDRRGEGWMLYNLACSVRSRGDAGDGLAHARRIAASCGDHELAMACDQFQRTTGQS